LAVLVAALGAAAVPTASRAAACAHASAQAGAATDADLRDAVRCLVNGQRAARGLPALRASGRLTTAAQRHSADMVRRRYFAHVTPEGWTLTDRVRWTGYLAGTGDWSLGEDIAWGTGALGTPAAIVRAWMASPPHRAVVLGRSFREAGVGIARGVPLDGVAGADIGATFVLDAGMAL
jgi:uncharacterized protein YkwD